MNPDARTALIVVDMQNLFADGRPQVVEAVNRRVGDAVERGWPVFYTRDVAPTELPAGDPDGRTDLHSGLDVRGTVVPKGPGMSGGFSGFVLAEEDTGPGDGGLSSLAGLLRREGVANVEVVGIAADVCVAATARDAVRLGYQVSVPLAATAFVGAHPRGDQAALDDLAAAGVILTEQSRR